MGEYECLYCDEEFWLAEPPEDHAVCDRCLEETKDSSKFIHSCN